MKREIGPVGTAARTIVGGYLFGSVVYVHFVLGPFWALPWIVGLIALPAIFIAWPYLRARRNPAPMRATGPVPAVLNVAIFFALLFSFLWLPAIAFMSNAVSIFYGLSMLLAALRGYAGCEVLAFSNLLLKRDDEVGCVAFGPLDAAEARWSGRRGL